VRKEELEMNLAKVYMHTLSELNEDEAKCKQARLKNIYCNTKFSRKIAT